MPTHAPQTRKPTARDLQRLAQAIDHTKLTFNPGENEEEAIRKLCDEAGQYCFYAVCVRPQHIQLAQQELVDTNVKVATVIGFPQSKVDLESERRNPTVGDIPTDKKVAEVQQALEAGADEFDVVLNVREFKGANGHDYTLNELQVVQDAAEGKPVKVIIETDLLSEEEIEAVTRLCVEADVAFVKTSTGMVAGGQGATPHAVAVIWQTIDELEAPTQIKASGGIKTQQQALDYLKQGVSRLGTSAGVGLLKNTSSSANY